MSMVTVSTKRDRIYTRAFDHEEARRLREDGWTYPALAERYGVSATALQRVCNPRVRERMDARSNDWIREHMRAPCLGGCGRLVWLQTPGRSGYCPTCVGKRKAAVNVREGELRCTRCGEWKADAEFGTKKRKTRRGRRTWCRPCEAAARRAHRHANSEQERTYARNRKRKGKAMAKYVVMRKDHEGRWEEHSRVDATSRLHAIEKAADAAGKWVAVNVGQLTELEVAPATAFRVVKDEPAESDDESSEKTKNCRVRECLCMAQPGSEFCEEHALALDRSDGAETAAA